MVKVAILVDGGFYRQRAYHLFGEKQPRNAQTNLNAIAVHILKTKENSVNYTEYSTTTARLWQKSCIILYWESR